MKFPNVKPKKITSIFFQKIKKAFLFICIICIAIICIGIGQQGSKLNIDTSLIIILSYYIIGVAGACFMYLGASIYVPWNKPQSFPNFAPEKAKSTNTTATANSLTSSNIGKYVKLIAIGLGILLLSISAIPMYTPYQLPLDIPKDQRLTYLYIALSPVAVLYFVGMIMPDLKKQNKV